MSIYKRLLQNIFQFAIGNLGSKFVIFLMLPFYTYHLSTSEYGKVDLITNTIYLIIPIVTMNLMESVFRFSMDKTADKSSVFSSVLLTCCSVFVIFLGGYLVLDINIFGSNLDWWFLGILFFQIIQSVSKQFIRALQKIKVFMYSDLINTTILVAMNILLIGVYDIGVKGYLISLLAANATECIFLFVTGKLINYVSVGSFNLRQVKLMVIYSSPLITNAIMWWIINSGNRYIITYFEGLDANGVYSVAAKFPTIINILYVVFNRAWQISALEEYNAKDISSFYTRVFEILSFFLISSVSLYLLINKPFITAIVSPEFSGAWKFVPFLLIGVIFQSFSSFVGTSYITSKNTKGAFITSFFGALSNILLSIILVPLMGIQGACISTAIAFFVMFVLRIKDTQKTLRLNINYRNFTLTLILITAAVILNLTIVFLHNILQLICFIGIILINKSTCLQVITKFKQYYYAKLGSKRSNIS